ncbi:MAG: hypothetical protein HWE07_15250 [Cytophagia bacterium]|nr:hypothetical protein [Cytophagia bacterium]
MKRFIITIILCSSFYQLRAQRIEFPLNMDAQAFKDSLVEVFNYPIYAKSKIEDDDKVFARFPWLKAIDDHPRYSVSFGYDKDDLIVGYKYMRGFSIKAENWSKGNLIGDYATFNLPFENFNAIDSYTKMKFTVEMASRKFITSWEVIWRKTTSFLTATEILAYS